MASQSMHKGEYLCVNSTEPFLAATLNSWDNTELRTYRTNITSTETIADGPYYSGSLYGGIDFGMFIGSFSMKATQDTYVSLGLTIFNMSTLARVISNHPNDKLYLDAASEEYLLITNSQHVEYFNGAPSTIQYSIDMDTEPGDLLTFWSNSSNVQDFTGHVQETLFFDQTNPVQVIWATDREIISGYVRISTKSTKYKPKRYVRVITDDIVYSMIPSFEISQLEVWQIVLIVIACVIFFVIILIIVIAICKYRLVQKKKKYPGEFNNEANPETTTELASV